MIRLRRPKQVPKVLATKGSAARQRDSEAFTKGARQFTFDPKIYGHPTVKRVLRAMQHDKCCFCESKVSHVASGHIEHFRPKSGARQGKNAPLLKPGYFWLAYEWTNLLFCCEICNSRFKGNLFPLLNPKRRARGPKGSVASEQPVFIDPTREDPSAHIGFRDEYPFAIGGSQRGAATWAALGLDREELAAQRRDHLQQVRLLQDVRDRSGDADLRAKAADLLQKFVSDKWQWSSMARAALQGRG